MGGCVRRQRQRRRGEEQGLGQALLLILVPQLLSLRWLEAVGPSSVCVAHSLQQLLLRLPLVPLPMPLPRTTFAALPPVLLPLRQPLHPNQVR